jgi:hypothetical protein
MKKYIEFAEKVAAVKEAALDLTPEQCSALGVLDQEFKRNAEILYKLFGTMFEFEEFKKNSKEEKVEAPTETVAKTKTKTTTKTRVYHKKPKPPVSILAIPEGYHRHPVYDNLYANKDGIILKDGKPVTMYRDKGYLKFRNGKRSHMVARIVYECCSGEVIPKTKVIKYINDNKTDCYYSNLTITKNHVNGGKLDDYIVAQVSEKIALYAVTEIPITAVPNKIAGEMRISASGVKSILDGNYSSISGKYFYIGPGKKIIPVQQTKEETKQKSIDDPCETVLQFGLKQGMEVFNEKYLSGQRLTDRDLIVPITAYMYNEDGTMAPTATIKDKILKEYGSEIVPSDILIQNVKQKKVGKSIVEAAAKIK